VSLPYRVAVSSPPDNRRVVAPQSFGLCRLELDEISLRSTS
jgi:hypothetical protein